jgi:hypothetical protein
MSDSKKALYGNIEVPVTKELRAGFKKVTKGLKNAVPREVQLEMLGSCETPEAQLELLGYLIELGMEVPDIHRDIRLSSEQAQSLCRRVHSVRYRQKKEAPASRLAVV